ncbi:hypothetical protein MNB_SV-13-1368 [hydrothermal vent metagenome]|uniref:Nitroreductase domain-containing protein n=1 Tax=hydrothermal vent metagenome TaxID=652676 RepID=A0A1W1C546_9ZZZZ
MFNYHQQTKHSYYSVRSNPNQIDWSEQPSTYKSYPKFFKKFPLVLGNPWHDLVYYSGSISAEKVYPPSTKYSLRTNPSAGALYPNELYFQARGIGAFPDGIYHYEVKTNCVTLLHGLKGKEGLELYMGYTSAMRGILFLVSCVYYRSSWKYKNRGFRYCLLDAGHLLGSIESSALLMPHTTEIRYDIERQALNKMFGFMRHEFFVAGASVCVPIPHSMVEPFDLGLAYVDASGTFEANALIEEAYIETSSLQSPKISTQSPEFTYHIPKLRESIVARRSQRGFKGESMSKAQYEFILHAITAPILSDCDEKVDIFIVLNRVKDMPIGLYKEEKLITNKDYAKKAGYLCLEQYSLATEGAMTLFFVSSAKNYQALYQKAGMIGQRAYIASEYQDLGCSGIGAYYDDEVSAFVEEEGMVLYALAIGR